MCELEIVLMVQQSRLPAGVASAAMDTSVTGVGAAIHTGMTDVEAAMHRFRDVLLDQWRSARSCGPPAASAPFDGELRRRIAA